MRGRVDKVLPNRGDFDYIHVDFNGNGGILGIIEGMEVSAYWVMVILFWVICLLGDYL